MSFQTEQAAIQAATDSLVFSYVFVAALALFAYDTFLTLSQEIEFIWHKPLKLGTVLYLMARTCNGMVHFAETLFLIPLVGIQGLLFARAYAIAHHKRLVLAALGFLGVCAIIPALGVAIWNRCDITSSQANTVAFDVNTIAVILFDTAVVAITLASTMGTWRLYKQSVWDERSLTRLLAQQSLTRYGFVLTMTVADAIMVMTLRPTIRSVLSSIQNSLSAIIICRFHLELQRRNDSNNIVSWSLPSLSFGNFHTTSQRIHEAVIAEFGDLTIDEPIRIGVSGDEVVLESVDMPAATTGDIEIMDQLQGAETTVEA